MINRLKEKLRNYVLQELQEGLKQHDKFPHLRRYVIELNDVKELKKIFNWRSDPILDGPTLCEFVSVVDVNERRIRDAECIGSVVCNSNPSVVLEIGTSTGHTTALIASNAPRAHVYTLNIPPEGIAAGEGGVFTTVAPSREEIGTYYREKGLTNITQILANSATWEPDIGTVDVAFVDGCHDTEFVYNDTRKILRMTKPGSFILWHDFNPNLTGNYDWINSVCLGVEELYGDRLLNGPIFHVRDSWVGIYRVI
jgi:hypothetical protein